MILVKHKFSFVGYATFYNINKKILNNRCWNYILKSSRFYSVYHRSKLWHLIKIYMLGDSTCYRILLFEWDIYRFLANKNTKKYIWKKNSRTSLFISLSYLAKHRKKISGMLSQLRRSSKWKLSAQWYFRQWLWIQFRTGTRAHWPGFLKQKTFNYNDAACNEDIAYSVYKHYDTINEINQINYQIKDGRLMQLKQTEFNVNIGSDKMQLRSKVNMGSDGMQLRSKVSIG